MLILTLAALAAAALYLADRSGRGGQETRSGATEPDPSAVGHRIERSAP